MKHARLHARVAVLASLLGALCAPSDAQVAAGMPPRDGGYVPELRPHTNAVGTIEADVALPQFIVPDTGICFDPEKRTKRPFKPVRINHQLIEDPIYHAVPGSRPAPANDDFGGPMPAAAGPFQNFESHGFNDLTPPDCDLATNGTYIVTVTNDDFAVYDTCGNTLYTIDAEDYFGYDSAFLLFDPKIIYDPWSSRWVMIWHKKRDATQESTMVVAVTGGATPFGLSGANAYWYDVQMVQDDGTADESWADYYDLGYSNTAVYFSGNQFRWSGSFRWGRIRFVDKAQIYNAVAATFYGYSNLTNPDGTAMSTPRSVKMQSSWSQGGNNIDGIFLNSRGGGGDKITIRKLTTAFTGSSISSADITVGAYTQPPSAVQPSGATLDTINCRLMTAVATNDTLGSNGIELFTGLQTGFNSGADVRAHLMKFDPVNNTLKWESQFGSSGFDYWFPSVAADYSGSAYWVFTRTAATAGNEPEVRWVDVNKGVFSSASALVRDGDGSYGGFRWGDYFGGQLDWADYNENFSTPGRPAKMWLYAEYGRNNSWGTHVGAVSVFTQGDLSNVTPATAWNIAGIRGQFSGTTSRQYTLSFTGETGTRYEVTSLPSWLSASPDAGRLDQDGALVTLTLNNAVANSLAAGDYSDTVNFVDCFNGGATFSRTVNLEVQAPNLAIVAVNAADGTYNPGQGVPISLQVQNIGTSSTGVYTVDFYASSNTTISSADNYMDSRSFASLAAGASRTSNLLIDAACIPAEGLYYIGAIASVTNDSSTANNTGFDATRVRLEYCPADVDQSCFVDTDDYTYFVSLFELGDNAADFDGTGFVDTDDFTAFVLAFESGC
ncbi:MAG TPA: GC-type dockerin domain-anchored protein [Phycisphaerales bacterium]|nr:GC-type dockerin domain-anchored protein [Phycisphaerales bacterium]